MSWRNKIKFWKKEDKKEAKKEKVEKKEVEKKVEKRVASVPASSPEGILARREKKEAPVKKKVVKKKPETAPKIKEEVKVLKPKSESNIAGRILIRPLITEKSALLGSEGKYSFEIAIQATKTEVVGAIHDLYGEKPVSINIIRVRGKKVRHGRVRGRRKNWKKAVITFKPGVKLEVFEGV